MERKDRDNRSPLDLLASVLAKKHRNTMKDLVARELAIRHHVKGGAARVTSHSVADIRGGNAHRSAWRSVQRDVPTIGRGWHPNIHR